VRKLGFFQPVAKYEDEKASKYFEKNLRQVVLSAKKKERGKRNKEETTTKSNLLK